MGIAAIAVLGLRYGCVVANSRTKTTYSSITIHEEQIIGSRTYEYGRQFQKDSLRIEYGCMEKPTVVLYDDNSDDKKNSVDRLRFIPSCEFSDFKEVNYSREQNGVQELFEDADKLYVRTKEEMGVERIVKEELDKERQKNEKENNPRDWL